MKTFLNRLHEAFKGIERLDLRVGDVWLNPKQVVELEEARDPGYDRIDLAAVRNAFKETKGAIHTGLLWGARVFASDIVPENHVGLIPSDWDAKPIGPAGCMPF
jgi:hypothetical protein